MAQATVDGLETLTQACEPATFGVDQRDVLDESYRKAGKMDTNNFATTFDIHKYLLIDRIHKQLFDAEDKSKPITAELYKLNVYGTPGFISLGPNLIIPFRKRVVLQIP